MLETEDVDDEYFTPVVSTTLASIFKDNSNDDADVNPSLKYKPPPVKKSEEKSKADDAGTSQCIFSCSLIAYEWVNGTHVCKGKVGFAMIRAVKTAVCKIILYSPDKSTLSCTTIMPKLEITQKGAMILLYDDIKKYWGLCFSNKIIEKVKELLKKENVIVKPYINPESIKPDIESFDSDEATDETDSSSLAEDGATTSRNNKASILNRIANVGHAILPQVPASPIKKSTPLDTLYTTDVYNLSDKSTALPDSSLKPGYNNSTIQNQKLTKSIAIQTCQNNVQPSNLLINNVLESTQTSVASVPLVNNQIFTYVNGYMVPLHLQVPVIDNVNCASTCADIDLIINRLNQLKGVVKTMETKHLQNKDKSQPCKCKPQGLPNDFPSKSEMAQTEIDLKYIFDLEETIRIKDDTIKVQQQSLNNLNEKIESIKQDLNVKIEEMNQMIQKAEADMFVASTVKNLMNNTFRSLASNFDNDVNYTGNSIKGILAAVIKKKTIETLNTLLTNKDTDITSKPGN